MQPEEIASHLASHFDGLVEASSWGERSFFYNPDGELPRGVYFCTIKDHDGANDKASNLNREGVFRVSTGLPRELYEERFGSLPGRPGKGGVVETGDDFTAINTLMPHPVYAWMGWVQVLSPTREHFEELQPLFQAAYHQTVGKYKKAASRRKKDRVVGDQPGRMRT